MYFFGISSIIFLILYFWRRIANLECYNMILEKRIASIKKENKELRDKLKGDNNISNVNNEDDVVMNEVFNELQKEQTSFPSFPNFKCTNDKCEIVFMEINNTKQYNKEDNEDTITKIIDNDKQETTEIDEIDALINDKSNTKIENIELKKEIKNIDLPVANHINEEVESNTDSNINYNKTKLNKMNVEKLKEICASLNLSTEGTKNVLIDRIIST